MTQATDAMLHRIAAEIPDTHAGDALRSQLPALQERLADIAHRPERYPSASQLLATLNSIPAIAKSAPDILVRRIERVMVAADQDALDAALYALDGLPGEDIIDLGQHPAALAQGAWRADSLRSAELYWQALRDGTYLLTPALPGFAHQARDRGRWRIVLLTPGGAPERFEGTLRDLTVALNPLFRGATS